MQESLIQDTWPFENHHLVQRGSDWDTGYSHAEWGEEDGVGECVVDRFGVTVPDKRAVFPKHIQRGKYHNSRQEANIVDTRIRLQK